MREDVETDGRHAKVAFGQDFLADARRRDFTINALSVDAEGRIYDRLGGLEDLAAGRVRFIGDADARIREDFLRILRFFRFSARFGGGALDRDGLSACVRHRCRPRAAVARAGARRMPEAPCRAARRRGRRAMGERGILGELFGFADPARLERAIAIETGGGLAPDGLFRLAALCVIVEEDAERLGERLRLSNAEGERLVRAAAALARLHGVAVAPAADALRRLLFAFGRRGASRRAAAGAGGGACRRRRRRLRAGPALPDARLRRRNRRSAARTSSRSAFPRARASAKSCEDFERLWVEAGFPSDDESVERLIRAAAEARTAAPYRASFNKS